MKKLCILWLSVLFTLPLFTSCNLLCINHVDENSDFVCDNCGDYVGNYALLVDCYKKEYSPTDKVTIKAYYGEFESGAIVAMIESGYYTLALWEEEIEDITIRYSNGNRIQVLYEGKFYTLTEAYEKGYLTYEDLQIIAGVQE